ncbi:MAG: hypothetical protein ACKVQJ_06615 [Pyrinomonadaceae bacterium]
MKHTNSSLGRGFGGDTMIVLFFLALEYGRGLSMFSTDALLMGLTMLMLLILPYFLPSNFERPSFANWMLGRSVALVFGLILGVAFDQSVGVVLPGSLRFLPMTFLIMAAMVSCYIQFYGLTKLRLAE